MKSLFEKYCSAEWLPVINHHKAEFTIKAKGYIFKEGEPVRGLYVIDDGFVKVTSTFGDGDQERILRLSNCATILGHRAVLLKNYSISAIALTDCKVSFIPLTLFTQLIKANPEFALYMFEFITQELCDSEEQQRILTIQDVRQRMAYIINKLHKVFGFKNEKLHLLAFTLSRKDFATLANTTYETIIRTLTFLEKEKLILNQGKEIRIINQSALQKLALGIK